MEEMILWLSGGTDKADGGDAASISLYIYYYTAYRYTLPTTLQEALSIPPPPPFNQLAFHCGIIR